MLLVLTLLKHKKLSTNAFTYSTLELGFFVRPYFVRVNEPNFFGESLVLLFGEPGYLFWIVISTATITKSLVDSYLAVDLVSEDLNCFSTQLVRSDIDELTEELF